MATTYYLHGGLATGNHDGSSAANAWASLQSAIDGLNQAAPPTATDTVLCYGSETTAAKIDWDTACEGTAAAGWVKFIGVNASWVNDGTYYTIDGNSGAHDLIYVTGGTDYVWLENLHLTNCDNDLVEASSACIAWVCHHCKFSIAAYGFQNTYLFDYLTLNNCVFSAITTAALDYPEAEMVCVAECKFIHCGTAFDMGLNAGPFLYNCLIHGCTTQGFKGQRIGNCVLDGNGNGLVPLVAAPIVILNSRITNNTNGILGNVNVILRNVYMNNTDDLDTIATLNELLNAGVSTINLVQHDSAPADPTGDNGYVDSANHDFNLQSDAQFHDVAVVID